MLDEIRWQSCIFSFRRASFGFYWRKKKDSDLECWSIKIFIKIIQSWRHSLCVSLLQTLAIRELSKHRCTHTSWMDCEETIGQSSRADQSRRGSVSGWSGHCRYWYRFRSFWKFIDDSSRPQTQWGHRQSTQKIRLQPTRLQSGHSLESYQKRTDHQVLGRVRRSTSDSTESVRPKKRTPDSRLPADTAWECSGLSKPIFVGGDKQIGSGASDSDFVGGLFVIFPANSQVNSWRFHKLGVGSSVKEGDNLNRPEG